MKKIIYVERTSFAEPVPGVQVSVPPVVVVPPPREFPESVALVVSAQVFNSKILQSTVTLADKTPPFTALVRLSARRLGGTMDSFDIHLQVLGSSLVVSNTFVPPVIAGKQVDYIECTAVIVSCDPNPAAGTTLTF